MHFSSQLMILLATARSIALVQQYPVATQAVDAEIVREAYDLAPTPAPLNERFGAVDVRDLFARQAQSTTCGFTDGNFDSPFVCTGYCTRFTNSYVACCATGSGGTAGPDCAPNTVCENWTTNDNQGTGAIQTSQTIACGESFPWCGTSYLTWDDDTYTRYACFSGAGNTIYLNQKPRVTDTIETTLVSTALQTSVVSITRFASITSTPSTTSDTTTSESAISTPISPIASPSSSGPLPPPPAEPTETDTEPEDTPNTGAIAGGVVGGVGAIALVGGIVLMLVRRKRREHDAAFPEISN